MIGLRASDCTFVASTTTSFPAVSRFDAMKCRTSKASFVAAWLFSSSETRPRQKSEERTSVGRKCFRAKLDCLPPRDRQEQQQLVLESSVSCQLENPEPVVEWSRVRISSSFNASLPVARSGNLDSRLACSRTLLNRSYSFW